MSSTGIFLKLDNITGESTDTNHKQWIELRGIDLGIYNNAHIASSGARKLNKGTASFQHVHCVKIQDSSSVKLLSAVAKGDFFNTVNVEICTMFNNAMHPYLTLELNDCMISAITAKAQEGAGYAEENITLVYSKIKWTYTALDADGKPGSKVGPEGWDLVANSHL